MSVALSASDPSAASLERLCIHTITLKSWSLPVAAEKLARAGVRGITVWRDALAAIGPKQARTLLADSGLRAVSVCRGGFFPSTTAEGRQRAIDDNRRAIAEAHALGAPMVVLVCGSLPDQSLEESRRQIADGIAALLPECEAAGVRVAIEPLHPMYAADRSAINTLAQANDLVEELGSPWAAVAVDVYHVWWDPALESEIARCGKLGALAAFHVCDWRSPTTDLLNDRGLMGEGCIPLRKIRAWVERAGFKGFNEVEIFSHRLWALDPDEYLARIVTAYREYV